MDDALNLFYDMVFPSILRRISINEDGNDEVCKMMSIVLMEYRIERSNRQDMLRYLPIILNRIVDGNVQSSERCKAEAIQWTPILREVVDAEDMAEVMEGMMQYAMTDKRQHAELLYSIYDQLFDKRMTQLFPSTRVNVYRIVPQEGSWMDVQRKQTEFLKGLPHDPRVIECIERYKSFLERIWIPYLKQHSDLWLATVQVLDTKPRDSNAYLELFHLLGLQPTRHPDGGFYFDAYSRNNFPAR